MTIPSPANEQSPLLASHDTADVEAAPDSASSSPSRRMENVSKTSVVQAVLVLTIGVFVASVDGTLILATHPIIASTFNDLGSSIWLFAGFMLASAATQTMYGRLSDIYGRKKMVLISYALFTGGCSLVGVGQSMFQVILGRAISGAGGAGMTSLVSIIISDLLPIRDVAVWRSYINMAATTGRSISGPLGGWLVDMVGWRWSFVGQVPFMLLATSLVMLLLPETKVAATSRSSSSAPSIASATNWDRLRRIDFAGSLLLAGTLLAFLLPMEIGGVKIPWSHPAIPGLFVSSAVLLALFLRTERRATEPIMPLGIFSIRDANLSLLVQMCQASAQLGLMFSVPLYFQVSQNASNTIAGAHLFPAVAGNAVGGILSGMYIKRTGHYRKMIILATISSSLSYSLLLLRWHGNTNWLESLYITPGGFGTGIALSAVFISMQAVVDPDHLAPAITILYLSSTCASVIGMACMSTIMQLTVKIDLARRLLDLGLDASRRAEILSKSLSNIEYVAGLTGAVKAAAVSAFVDGIWWSHTVSLFLSLSALVCALNMGEKPLHKMETESEDAEA